MRTTRNELVSQAAVPGTEPAPTLGYANPKVFFSGARRYRSASGFWAIPFGLAVTAGLGYIAAQIMWDWGVRAALPARWAWAGSVAAVAALMASATAYQAWGWAVHLEVPVRVTEEGVENGRRVWRWQQVSGFGGTVAGPRRVQLDFVPGRGQLRFPRNLWTTPSLTDAEFTELVERLTPFLAEHHPHVRVDKTPRASE